ncbi:MAG: hypothetical protein JST08_06985 [Actinobacteria bacterium]|nr:hypothetical protein [Actinomycetota bacterium]
MAVAAPKRSSAAQAAPAPSRTAPPEPRKRPRDRPRPGGRTTAPRKVRTDDPPLKPGRRATSAGAAAKAAPARKAPARRKAAPKRRPAGVIPIAAGHAGRAAVAVTQLPESGLIHRLTRGRAWIGVLGVLLVGIVALNVVTLSFAASSGKVVAKNSELSKENSMLQSRVAQEYGQAKLRHAAAGLGLAMSTESVPRLLTVRKTDVAEAASRLAAAAASGAASAEEAAGEATATGAETTGGEATATGEEPASGEETTGGEEATTGEEAGASTTGESEYTPEELAIYEREYAELLASEGVTEVPGG